VALRAFKLARDAFSWVKHRELPDKEIVRSHLVRLRVGQHGGTFAAGRAGKTHVSDGKTSTDGWQLTEEGVNWVLQNKQRMEESLGTRKLRVDRQHVLQVLHHLRESTLFQAYQANAESFVPALGDLAQLLRCRVDTDDAVWSRRFAALRNQAQLAEQKDLLAFLENCEALRPLLAR
jgi:hypothetical protein